MMSVSVVDAIPADVPVPVRASGNLARLTPRQAQVIHLRAQGLHIKQVAKLLGISDQTVKNHVTDGYRALGVDDIVTAMSCLGWTCVPEDIYA